ncbi:hypothetical protein A2U01_0084942, partial [Trifolium medium]|nr:hypothetical protein [Trifolium medium]
EKRSSQLKQRPFSRRSVNSVGESCRYLGRLSGVERSGAVVGGGFERGDEDDGFDQRAVFRGLAKQIRSWIFSS